MRLPVTPTTTLWRALRDEVRRDYPGGRVLVAVDGIDTAVAGVIAFGRLGQGAVMPGYFVITMIQIVGHNVDVIQVNLRFP